MKIGWANHNSRRSKGDLRNVVLYSPHMKRYLQMIKFPRKDVLSNKLSLGAQHFTCGNEVVSRLVGFGYSIRDDLSKSDTHKFSKHFGCQEVDMWRNRSLYSLTIEIAVWKSWMEISLPLTWSAMIMMRRLQRHKKRQRAVDERMNGIVSTDTSTRVR
jgi:hypothetical protein